MSTESGKKEALLKKVDLAYFAGLFDGEGCISIDREKHKTRNKRYPLFTLRVMLQMANPYIPKLFQFAFGGYFFEIKRKRLKPNWKPEWAWGASARVARDFLLDIKPYLKLKQSEAELGILFQQGKKYHSVKGRWGNPPKTEAELAIEEAQYILMRGLKDKTGVTNGK